MCHSQLITRCLLTSILSCGAFVSLADEVAFDLPSSIECRDVTTVEFAQAHPELKLIEAKLRISARLLEGDTESIVDFEYLLETGSAMRVQQYMPNTTLESAVSEDQIEVTAGAESTSATGIEAQLAGQPLLISASHEKSSKQTATSHYQRLAPKDVVLASGTIDREHGVFFRIRPSRTASLEGGREFSIIASVPKSWRGGLCYTSCAAKASRRSFIRNSLETIGSAQAQIGMYLSGDSTAATVAEELRLHQDERDTLAARTAKRGTLAKVSQRLLSTEGEADDEVRLKTAEQKVNVTLERLESLSDARLD